MFARTPTVKDWTVWQTISWITAHERFFSVGLVVTEYAMKVLLSKLPMDKACKFHNALKTMGVDVKGVSMGSVGQSVLMSLANTGAQFQPHAEVQDIMHDIKWLGHYLPPTPEMHARFANFLCSHGWCTMRCSYESVIQRSYAFYLGSHWIDSALFDMNMRLMRHVEEHHTAPTRSVVAQWLAETYAAHSAWLDDNIHAVHDPSEMLGALAAAKA